MVKGTYPRGLRINIMITSAANPAAIGRNSDMSTFPNSTWIMSTLESNLPARFMATSNFYF